MILPAVPYERKNIIFHEKIESLRKAILLIMFFVIEFYLIIASYQFLKNDCIFMNYGLLFRAKYSL